MPLPFTHDGLSEKQRAFVAAYDGNGTAAARSAGYKGTDVALAVQAHRLLKIDRILDALRARGRVPMIAAAPESPPADAEVEPGLAWRPQPGPQTAFAECDADIAIIGGAAGGGKSNALLYELVRWAHVPGYRAIIFRRTNPELTGGGGLWDESHTWYPLFGGRPRQTPEKEWLFPSGARIEMRHLQHDSDAKAHHGRQYAQICFDELTTFTEKQFWYLVSRLRSTCGVRPYIRASCNPDPDSFVADLVAWWLDAEGYPILERAGVLRWLVRANDLVHWYDTKEAAATAFPDQQALSFTFIPARLKDNPALTRVDPSYLGRLQSLANVDRQRLLGANWKIRASAGLVLPRGLFKISTSPPSKIVRTVRCWDKGATAPTPEYPDPDWTRGVRVSLCEEGEIWIDDLVSIRDRPAKVFALMRKTAEADGKQIVIGLWQEVGASGIVDNDATAEAIAGYPYEVERIGVDKVAYAKVWAPKLERGLVYVLRAPWTEAVLSECDGFPPEPHRGHDDIVDAISRAALMLIGVGMAYWTGLRAARRDMVAARGELPRKSS